MRKRIFRRIKKLLGKQPERKTVYIDFKDWQMLYFGQAWFPDNTMEETADMVLRMGLDSIKACDPEIWGDA